ncbi:hypothetical protein P168DRAFT_316226 [Aspergillus campestris IBT 28561]|uniref:Lipid droplet-associated hydrolase n=1 Tax=Aspergillus campestris (strain IBT 28561) TaxID=1392248 RepID=A0A2I1D8K0_ASPC2|nr:uncharacterized protein P168DRAFT_316226 [Aspergillus campestris IBT 28561]PKY06205.1 hypothetical protein P168DRAFT_316226 [Aspergillus campestris IBT 28561]
MDTQLQPDTHISPDRFKRTILPTQQGAEAEADHSPIVIYMISGNPGLISYYHTFLSTLADRLSSLCTKQDIPNQFHIYGHSLDGFEVEESSPNNGNGNGNPSTTQPCSLEEQICFVQRKLDSFIGGLEAGPRRAKVILVGHSVGSYIAMEVLRRHRERSDANSASSGAVGFDIIGGAMLFPTVVDIALSPSGRKLTSILSFVPQLALLAGIFVRILVACVPDLILQSLVRFYMQSASDEMVTATTSFIKSKRGVRQALHMAADEMQTITADKWSDDVWGVPGAGEPLTRLFFYFGRNDHWVAERTRDDIIHMRGRHVAGGPKMVVCEEGLPHAFVLKRGDTDVMATKVAGMVMEIVQRG